MTITLNGQTYTPTLVNGIYIIETSIETAGLYPAVIEYRDEWDDLYTETITVQVLVKLPIELDVHKDTMWIFSKTDFSIVDILEVASYEINIDEETNSTSVINVLKETTAEAGDIICIKHNAEIVYWGVIKEIQNTNGAVLNQYLVNYITNLFDRKIQLTNEDVIRSTGIEDFIKDTIEDYFTDSSDTFTNITWLTVTASSHTPKQTSVTNVENGIYNLHTYMTNCTQNYNIVYSFSIVNGGLVLDIKNETFSKELIDTNGHNVTNYIEVYQTDVVAKVIVLYDKVGGADNPRYLYFIFENR